MKVTEEMERLNTIKTIQMWRFLELSRQLETEYGLSPLYEVTSGNDRDHVKFSMWFADEPFFTLRMQSKKTPIVLTNARTPLTTQINRDRLRQNHEQYLANTNGNPGYVVAGHQLWELLEDQSTWEREHKVA